jgi:hypothetical protein
VTRSVKSETSRLKRLAILALIASSGNRGTNLPGLICGLRLIPAEEMAVHLDELQRQGLIRRGSKRHPDGDRDVVCLFVDPELELAVNV